MSAGSLGSSLPQQTFGKEEKGWGEKEKQHLLSACRIPGRCLLTHHTTEETDVQRS